MPEPVRFRNLFQSPSVSRLLGRAQRLAALQQDLEQTLAPDLRGRVRVANLRDDRLIVFVSDATAATRLRFSQSELLAALAPELPAGIRRLEARVRPEMVAM